jgi:sugar phosphate isomerase/epimerase
MALFHRRDFLKTTGAIGLGAGLLGRIPALCSADDAIKEAAKGAPHAEKLGWLLGVNTYTFNKFSVFEALEKIAALGLKYAEIGPGRLSQGDPTPVSEVMPEDARKKLQQKAGDLGIKIITYSSWDTFKDPDYARKAFEFAKIMGVENFYFEASADRLDWVDKLCEEYKIHVAIHNHPKDAPYWSPDKVLKAIAGRSKYIGALADTGHWKRSGLVPVECLKKLEGHIVCFHFKDLIKDPQEGYHDVPWGTGVCDVKAMLAEIHRQKLKAPFSFEYEYRWDDNAKQMAEMAQSVVYFDKVAEELLAQDEKRG